MPGGYMWTGTNYWGYKAVPHTAQDDPNDWKRHTKEWVEKNYWPHHLSSVGPTTGYKDREERRDRDKREMMIQDFAGSGVVRNEKDYGRTSPSKVRRAKKPDLRGGKGISEFDAGIGSKYGYNAGLSPGDVVAQKLESFEGEEGTPMNLENIDLPSEQDHNARSQTSGDTPLSVSMIVNSMVDQGGSVDNDTWMPYFNTTPDPNKRTEALNAMPQPGDTIFRGSEMQKTSAGGKVTGWIKDEASGEFVGTRPDGSVYRSKTKPAIAEGIDKSRQEPQSKADLLRDYSNSIFDSIQGYYDQARSELDRTMDATRPRYTYPSPQDLGYSSTEAYKAAWRGQHNTGGVGRSDLTNRQKAWGQNQTAQYHRWKGEKFEAINTLEAARDKAIYNAEQQALGRNYDLEKQLITARNKMQDPYAVRDRAGKALDAAKRLAENSSFIMPTATVWQSRAGELSGAQEGKARNKYIVNETAMPPGTSSEYINMARQAADLLNTYYSGTSTYEQVNSKALGFEKASIGYEQAALRNQRGIEAARVQREQLVFKREVDTKALPSDSGSKIFGAGESGAKSSTGAMDAQAKATPSKATPKKKGKKKSKKKGKKKKKKSGGGGA